MSKQRFPGGNEVSELFGNSLAWRLTPRIPKPFTGVSVVLPRALPIAKGSSIRRRALDRECSSYCFERTARHVKNTNTVTRLRQPPGSARHSNDAFFPGTRAGRQEAAGRQDSYSGLSVGRSGGFSGRPCRRILDSGGKGYPLGEPIAQQQRDSTALLLNGGHSRSD